MEARLENRNRGDSSGQRGGAMVLALLLTAALVGLGATFLMISHTDRTIAANRADGSQAFHLAEAGLEHAVAELPDQDFDTLLAGGGMLFAAEGLGGGTYRVSVANNVAPAFPQGSIPADAGGGANDTDGFLVVNSIGTFEGAERGVEVIVRQLAAGTPPWPYPYAAFGDTGLEASGGAGSSEFYGAVGTNADMTFSGGTPKVYGNAWAVGTIPAGGWVTGTATSGAPPQALPLIACPPGLYGPAPMGTFTFGPITGKLTISSADVVFPSGTYYFSEINKSGGGNISIEPGADVQIYVSGKIAMSGGGWNNPNGTATSLQFWGCGATAATWTITGPQDSWFSMYAPTRSIRFSGSGHKHGSFIGSDFENSGPGDVVWDSSLVVTLPAVVRVVQGTWTELW